MLKTQSVALMRGPKCVKFHSLLAQPECLLYWAILIEIGSGPYRSRHPTLLNLGIESDGSQKSTYPHHLNQIMVPVSQQNHLWRVYLGEWDDNFQSLQDMSDSSFRIISFKSIWVSEGFRVCLVWFTRKPQRSSIRLWGVMWVWIWCHGALVNSGLTGDKESILKDDTRSTVTGWIDQSSLDAKASVRHSWSE